MSDLHALFSPRSVAVLGVSRNPAKLGYRLLQNVKASGYGGRLYPVNPTGEPILDTPTIASVDELPDGVDLALVSLPAAAVPAAVRALARRRVRSAVVLSSGFGEVDAGGRGVQAEILETARSAGLRLVGPNCMGVYSAPAALNGTYFWDLPRLPGTIAVVSQSGAYGGLIFRQLGARGLGIARFVSIGNQADVDVADVLEFLLGDSATGLVACFIEALRDDRFVRLAAAARGRKPIVVLKGGRSDAGRRAAGSHTGSLAGSYETYRAAFRHAGVVLAEETEEFFDVIETLAVAGPARARARSVAILTVSGGPSVVAADTAEREGIAVPPVDAETRGALRPLLPPFAAVGNPVDLTPQVEPARIAAAVRLVLDAPAMAGAIAVNVGLDIPEFADAVVAAAAAAAKPVVAFAADAPVIAARLRAGGVPVLPSPERAVRAWRALVASPLAAPRAPARRPLPADLERALGARAGALSYAVSRRLLEAYGVRFCREAIVATAEEAAAAAEAIGYPVVVKANAPGMLHKTEANGVRLGVRERAAVRDACQAIAASTGVSGFVVQQQVGPGVELLVGVRRDPLFGPVVLLGTGGVLAEVVRDVSLRLAPLGVEAAREMLTEGLRPRLLAGPRGLRPVDAETLVAAITAVGDLAACEPRILEIDLNPVIAAGTEVVAVDVAVIVGDPS